jgi:hypothetical protein
VLPTKEEVRLLKALPVKERVNSATGLRHKPVAKTEVQEESKQ